MRQINYQEAAVKEATAGPVSARVLRWLRIGSQFIGMQQWAQTYGKQQSRSLFAKSRVSPLKALSMPRLAFKAAFLAVVPRTLQKDVLAERTGGPYSGQILLSSFCVYKLTNQLTTFWPVRLRWSTT